MAFLALMRKVITNKVVIYMVTRYIIYFITFLSSMIIAVRMGPYYLGIWGFVLLLIRYFHIIDFGVGNSMTVLLVQNKEDEIARADYEMSAMFILSGISIGVVLVALYYYLFGIPLFEKYELGYLFYFVCIVAILQYFNDYFLKIYRVKGKMFEFTFYQSIIQILVFVAVFITRGEKLVYLLMGVYVISHLMSLFLFLRGKKVALDGKFSRTRSKEIVNKGTYLFIYNFCFYMIIISTKTIIGAYYSVEEFGYFTFAYTLAHAAILLLTAFSTLITPKLLDKFNSPNNDVIESAIRMLRINYVFLSHGLMYAAMLCFPILLYFLPNYAGTLKVINLTSLASILYANSFGYMSFLIVRNREKVIARNSFICLCINIIIAFVLVKIMHISYDYVVLATLISYFFYAYFSVSCGIKELSQRANFFVVIKDTFPLGILIPFLIATGVTIINNSYLMFLPLFIFIIMNIREIKEIYGSFKRILYNPNVIDI